MNKKYYISAQHDVYLDDYERGELENVNAFQIDHFSEEEKAFDAVRDYMENVVCVDEYTYKEYEGDNREGNDKFEIVANVLVDENNCPATKGDIKEWKEGKRKLYTVHIYIELFKLTPTAKLFV